jgi:hypothetical protein
MIATDIGLLARCFAACHKIPSGSRRRAIRYMRQSAPAASAPRPVSQIALLHFAALGVNGNCNHGFLAVVEHMERELMVAHQRQHLIWRHRGRADAVD